MEIRVLKYFLTIAREQSFSKAAKVLNISQPALSKQIKDLEDEYGTVFFERTTRSFSLTKEGLLFKEKAKEIINLVEKTETLLRQKNVDISGDIYIGCSESECNRIVMRTMYLTQKEYPNIKFHVVSGNAQYVTDQLEQGLFDLGIVVDPTNLTYYDFIKLPSFDTRGILMRKDSDLAKLNVITPNDLKEKPLIISSQELVKNEIAGWIGGNQRSLNIVGTFNLLFNAKLMVEEKMGYALTLEHLYNESEESIVCFKPLSPKLTIRSNVIWKKYKVFSKPVEIFLKKLQEEIKLYCKQ